MEPPINTTIPVTTQTKSNSLSSAELAKLVENVKIDRLPRQIEAALSQKQTVSLQNLLIDSVKSLPPQDGKNLIQIAANTKNGLLEITVAKALLEAFANTTTQLANLTGSKINLVFKPLVPASLSHFQLIVNPNQTATNITQSGLQQTGQNTPITQTGAVLSQNFQTLKTGSILQAIQIGKTTTTTSTPNQALIKNTPTANIGINNAPSQNANTTATLNPLLSTQEFASKTNLTSQNSGLTNSTVLNSQIQSGQQTANTIFIKVVHYGPPSPGLINPLNNNATHIVNGNNIPLTASDNVNATLQQGQVISHQTTHGAKQPIIQTSNGQLLLLAKSDLEVGAKIQFQIVKTARQTQQTIKADTTLQPQLPAQQNLEAAQNTVQPATQKPQIWGNFEALQTTLETDFPTLLNSFQNLLPTPSSGQPRQVSTMMFFFMNALQLNAGVAPWLGTPFMNALKAQQGNNSALNRLIGNLDIDISNGSSRVRESVSGAEFQRFTLPIQTPDQQIQPIFLYLKPYSEDQNQSDKESLKNTKKAEEVRFLVDLKLSRLGAVQVDGLFKSKNMHMILKLEKSLPQPKMIEMQERYETVLGSLGLEGGLRFQSTENWIYFNDHKS